MKKNIQFQLTEDQHDYHVVLKYFRYLMSIGKEQYIESGWEKYIKDEWEERMIKDLDIGGL